MVLPTSILDMIEEANDYYFPTVTAVYLKVDKGSDHDRHSFLHTAVSAVYAESGLAARGVRVCGGEGYGEYPSDFSVLLLELSIDGLRLAAMKHSDNAEHAPERDRRYRHGRVFCAVRMV